MADRKWEDALAVIAAKEGAGQGTVTNRSAVTAAPWFEADHLVNPMASRNAGTPSGYDFAWSQGWSRTNYVQPTTTGSGGQTTTDYTYQIGFKLAPGALDSSKDSALYKFLNEPVDIIGPPLNTLLGNTSVSLGSFDSASSMLTGMLTHLTDAENELKSWVKDINVPDSEMQGTAAGALRRALVAVQHQIAYLHTEVTNKGDIPRALDDARTTLLSTLNQLNNAHSSYITGPFAQPYNHVGGLFFNALSTVKLDFDASGSPSLNVPGFGDPTQPGFWTALEQLSKETWQGALSPLDTSANDSLAKLDSQYQTAIAMLPSSALPAPPYRDLDAPKPPGNNTNNGDKPPGDVPPPGGGNDTDAPPGNGDAPPGGNDDKKQPPPPPTSKVTGPPKTDSNVPPPPPQSKTNGPPNIGGNNTGANNTLLDNNNQSIKDSKGNETQIPPGSHINKDRTITGPDGKLLLGPDKKPLIAPPNSHIGSNSYVNGNSGSNSKQQLKEQQELQEKQLKQQKLNQQQQLKDQQELQERQQKLQQLNQQQQLKQRKAQEAQEVAQENAYQKALSHVRGQARTETGNEFKAGGGGRNKLNLEEGPPRVNERLPNSRSLGDPKTSLSERVRRTSANEPDLAAETAVRESSAMNRTSSNGQPMMPPMGGGGGGGGGGRDRERRTWLAEDEETWGTSQEATPGVIG
ncbi:hypothetical protein [Streptomyces sp. NPDC059398]|uniref:hypothetical protein n=1 Tax=Streptomyces sp. NPDC059398 TaxID=3346820 RepID=UPI003686E154